MALDFAGDGSPMTTDGLNRAWDRLSVKAAEIWAVLTVETLGCGFLPDRRPQILFERHVFHRETSGAFDQSAPDLSNATAGGYGSRGAAQYDRLAKAVQLDRQAALRSTSWGIGQVMGFNAIAAGYTDVESMVKAMMSSEDEQLGAMLEWVTANQLDRPLRNHDWPNFARAYNGPNYAINQYDVRLAAAYQRYSTGLLPDLTVRAAQVYLTYLGLHPGPVDGTVGRLTRSALAQFQESQGLPRSGEVDGPTMEKLQDRVASLSHVSKTASASD